MSKSRKVAKNYNPGVLQDLTAAIEETIWSFAHAHYMDATWTMDDSHYVSYQADEWTPKLVEAINRGGDMDQVIADIIEDITPKDYPRYCIIADRIDFTAKIVRLETIADLAKTRESIKTA